MKHASSVPMTKTIHTHYHEICSLHQFKTKRFLSSRPFLHANSAVGCSYLSTNEVHLQLHVFDYAFNARYKIFKLSREQVLDLRQLPRIKTQSYAIHLQGTQTSKDDIFFVYVSAEYAARHHFARFYHEVTSLLTLTPRTNSELSHAVPLVQQLLLSAYALLLGVMQQELNEQDAYILLNATRVSLQQVQPFSNACFAYPITILALHDWHMWHDKIELLNPTQTNLPVLTPYHLYHRPLKRTILLRKPARHR